MQHPPDTDAQKISLRDIVPKTKQLESLSQTNQRVQEAIKATLEGRLGVQEKKEIKPREYDQVALSRNTIRYAILRDGTVLIKSEEGIQSYLLDEERGLRPKPGSPEGESDVSETDFVEIVPEIGSILPHAATLKSRQHFENLGRWEEPKPKILHASSFLKLNPRSLGTPEEPICDLALESPKLNVANSFFDLPTGEHLRFWSVSSKPGPQGAFVEVSLKSSTDPNAAADSCQSTQIAFFTDLQGHVIHLEPSREHAFPKYPLGEGMELISLGNAILIQKGKEIDTLQLPALEGNQHLGKMRSRMTIGNTEYMSFGGGKAAGGQLAVAINRSTGKIDKTKGKGGIFTGEAIIFDQKNNRIYTLTDAKTGKKNVKKMLSIDVTEQKVDKRFQPLPPDSAREILTVVAVFVEGQEEALTLKNLDDRRNAIRKLLEGISFGTGDERVFTLDSALRAAVGKLDEVEQEVRREESVRSLQIGRLTKLKEGFTGEVGKLFQGTIYDPIAVESGVTKDFNSMSVGVMMEILRSYEIHRTGFVAETNQSSNISQVLEDDVKTCHDLVQKFDGQASAVRESLQKKLGGEISQQKSDGLMHLRGLLGAEGEMGHVAVASARNGLDKWMKFYVLIKELQKKPEGFFTGTHGKTFTLNDVGTQMKQLLDLETVRGQELTPEDVLDEDKSEAFHMAHIERLYPEIYALAVRKNVDPDKAEQFEEALVVVIEQAVRLRESESVHDIEEGAARLERDLQALEDGIFKTAALEHSPVHKAKLVQAKSDLQTKFTEAKTHLLRETSRERMQLSEMIREKTQKLCRAIESASRQQDSDQTLPMDQQSRVVWARVQDLTRGYDLQSQTKRPGLPEQAYSDRLEELFVLVTRLEDRYQDREKANEVWRELRNAVQKAMNRIESDKGYAKLSKHYVLEVPECYQSRIPKRIEPVALPLSGNTDVQSLQLETRPDVSSGTPRLVMTLLGNDAFQKELPVGRRYSRAIAALDWEAPQGDSPLRAHYKGPDVERTSVALSLLIDRLPHSDAGKFLISELESIVQEHADNDHELEGALAEQLKPHLADLKETHGLELNSDQVIIVAKNLAILTKGKQLEFTPDDWSQVLKPEITATDDLKNELDAARAFRDRFEEPLTILHAAIKRNQARVSRQMGLAQQQEPSRLPYDFRETGLNVVQMRELVNALQTCQSSPDKQGIVMTGDFGSGKTMLAIALANRMRKRVHMINGNTFGSLKSLDPYAATGNVSDQLSLLAATLTQMTGVMSFLDEGQFLPADLLNSLFDLLDVRGELSVSIDQDKKEDAEDVNIYSPRNKTKKGNTFIMSGNLSYTIENRATGERMTVDFVLPEALSRRVVKVSTDDIEEQNEFLWIASYIERGSGDLGIHPDDVKYLISKRLLHGEFQTALPIEANDPNLKTDFTLDPQRLDEIVKAIDYRCLAAKTLVNIQKASRRTRQMGGDISKLGTPPCWMTAVGGGNVKTLMPMMTHLVKNEAEARSLIREQLMGNTDDRGPGHKEDNILFLEHITADWRKFTEDDWKRAVSEAERIREEGLSPNPIVGPIRAVAGVLEKMKASLETAGGENDAVIREMGTTVATLGGQLHSAIAAFEKSNGKDSERKAEMETLVSALTGLSTALVAKPHTNGSAVASAVSTAPTLVPQGPSASPDSTILRLDGEVSGKLQEVLDLLLTVLKKPAKGSQTRPSPASSTPVMLKDTISS